MFRVHNLTIEVINILVTTNEAYDWKRNPVVFSHLSHLSDGYFDCGIIQTRRLLTQLISAAAVGV